MDSHQYDQLFESYFSGDMPEIDQVLFEAKLAGDPAMKAAFERQQDIVHALKAHRSAELKARMNHITIHPWTGAWQNTITKYVAYSMMGVAVLVGGYWLYPETESRIHPLNSLAIKIQQPDGVHFDLPHYTLDAIPLAVYPLAIESTSKPVAKSAIKKHLPAPIAVEIPEAQLSDEGSIANGLHFDVGAVGKVGEVPEVTSSQNVDVDRVNSSKYRFHYRLERNRLFLYGTFEQTPYEIIEINAEDNQKLFLYYHNHFYRLKNNAFRITPLIKIKKQSLIKKLNSLKAP